MAIDTNTKIYFGGLYFNNVQHRELEDLEDTICHIRDFFDSHFEKEEYRKRRRFIGDTPSSIPNDALIRSSVKNGYNIEMYAYVIETRFEDVGKYLEDICKRKGLDYIEYINGLEVFFSGNYTHFLANRPLTFKVEYKINYRLKVDGTFSVEVSLVNSERITLNAVAFSNATKLYALDTYDINNEVFIRNLIFQLANSSISDVLSRCYSRESEIMAVGISEAINPYYEYINQYLKEDTTHQLIGFLSREFKPVILIGMDEILLFVKENRNTIVKTLMETGALT